jgi:DNA-binding transcriptional LysR family regulator
LDFKKLKTFYLTVRTGSTARAAGLLKLTVPTLSVQLKNLERELDTKLFHHLPNKLVLTPQGQVFFGEVKQVLESVERAKASISNKQGDDFTGRLCVAIGSDIVRLFVRKLATFLKKHPRIEFTLLARAAAETLALVLAGDVDFGIGRFDSRPRGLITKDILENSIWCSFHDTHILARKDKIEIADLAKFRIITLTRASGTRRAIDHVFRRNRVEPQNILEVGSCQSAMEFVRLRVGNGLVHDVCTLNEQQLDLRFEDMSHFFGKARVSLIY